MNSERTIETAISLGTIKDLVASHLYAIGYANDNEEVDLEFGSINILTSLKDAQVPITIKLKKKLEVNTIRVDG